MKGSRVACVVPFGLCLLLVPKSCTLGSGDGTPFGLNMPWFHQEQYYYCVPAAIQMWAAYDGFRVSQTTIAVFVHAVAPNGTPANNIALGVDQFTATTDAFLKDAFFTDQGLFSTMQITSINNGRPLIAAFDQQHVVIPSGGAWHNDSSNGWDVWDEVVYQDPEVGPNIVVGSAEWMDRVTTMVIGGSATVGSKDYLNEYGPGVRVQGSSYQFSPQPM